jgi:hypothetical protein
MAVGGNVLFAATIPESSAYRLRRVSPATVGQARAYQAKVPTSSQATITLRRTRRTAGKLVVSDMAKASMAYKRILVTKGATSSKAKGTLDTTTTAQGNAPAIPANVTNGTPASKMFGWASWDEVYQQFSKYSTEKANLGFTGVKTTMGGGSYLSVVTSGQHFYWTGTPSNVVNPLGQTTDGKYNWHQGFAGYGVPTVNGQPYGTSGLNLGPFRFKSQIDSTYKVYIGRYARTAQNAKPPMGDWWNDATWVNWTDSWSNDAAGCRWLGGDGLSFDCESAEQWEPISCTSTTRPTSINAGQTIYETNTTNYYRWNGTAWVATTLAAIHAQVEARGFQVGQGIFTAFPACTIIVYEWRIAGGPYDSRYHDAIYPRTTTVQDQFFWGIMRAMQVANGTGQFIEWDAEYYKYHSPFETDTKRGMQGSMAIASQRLPAAVRNYILPRFGIVLASWAGTDGAPGYAATPEPLFSQVQALHRQWSMLGMRSEYRLNDTSGSPPQSIYTDTRTNPPGGHQPGMLAATSTTSQDSSVITVNNITQSRTGDSVTFTFTASHNYGIHHVHWTYYASNGISILSQGEATMTWNAGGGTRTTDFNNAYAGCSITISNASAGLYVILDIYSIIGQRTSRRVQLI